MNRPAVPTGQSHHLTVPGVACACGSAELIAVHPLPLVVKHYAKLTGAPAASAASLFG